MAHQLEDKIQELLSVIQEEFPEIAEVLDQAKARDLDETQAMEAMLHAISENPEMAERLNQMAMATLSPLREESELLKPESAEGPGIVFDSGVGMPRLNPLYEGALIERLQFDDDVPEARTGPLDPGVKPAVPVRTEARNPVALGHMLETASDQVAEEVAENREALAAHVERIAQAAEEGTTDLAILEQAGNLAVIARGSAETDPESYRRGQVPAPLDVGTPTGGQLAALSDQQRQQYTWKFLSTTQGRRSATRIIWDGIAPRLRSLGLEIADYRPPPAVPETDGVKAYAEWTYQLSGPNSTQSGFAFIDTAIAVLTARLIPQVDRKDELRLEVFSINTVDVRSVGWAARLMA
jgi:hypothetical protein